MTTEKWYVNGPESIDVGLVRRLRVSLMGGSVNVVAHDDPSCRVEVDGLTGRDLKVELDGDTLHIDHPQLGWQAIGTSVRTLVDAPSAQVYVLVPRRCDVNVKATSAEVLVAGVEGDVSLSTVSGEQFADQTGGTLSLSSVSGDVTAREHRGRVDVKTTTSDITVSGTLLEYTGNSVSGATVVDLLDASTRQFTHNSVTGGLTLRLADGTNPSYNLQTIMSRAHLGDDWIDPLHGRRHREDAPGEGEALLVRLNTVGGPINVIEPDALRESAATAQPDAPVAPDAAAQPAAQAEPDAQADVAAQGQADSADQSGGPAAPAASAAFKVDGSPVDFSGAPRVQRVNEPGPASPDAARPDTSEPTATGGGSAASAPAPGTATPDNTTGDKPDVTGFRTASGTEE